jgi:hypothetical protein
MYIKHNAMLHIRNVNINRFQPRIIEQKQIYVLLSLCSRLVMANVLRAIDLHFFIVVVTQAQEEQFESGSFFYSDTNH